MCVSLGLVGVVGQVDGWGKHVHSVWPEWVRDSNWALYFNINQTINIGQPDRQTDS